MDTFEQRLRDIEELKNEEIIKLRRAKLYTKEDMEKAASFAPVFISLILGLFLGMIVMYFIK